MTLLDLVFRRGQTEPEEPEPEESFSDELPSSDDVLWHFSSGVRSVGYRALLWSVKPPTTPGWYWVRRPGEAEFMAYEVKSGIEFGLGLNWAGPLATPYEPKATA